LTDRLVLVLEQPDENEEDFRPKFIRVHPCPSWLNRSGNMDFKKTRRLCAIRDNKKAENIISSTCAICRRDRIIS